MSAPPVGDVGFTVEVGGFVEIFPSDNFRIRAELRQGLGGHEGLVGDLGADLDRARRRHATSSRSARARAGRTTTYHDAYFGVPAGDPPPPASPPTTRTAASTRSARSPASPTARPQLGPAGLCRLRPADRRRRRFADRPRLRLARPVLGRPRPVLRVQYLVVRLHGLSCLDVALGRARPRQAIAHPPSPVRATAVSGCWSSASGSCASFVLGVRGSVMSFSSPAPTPMTPISSSSRA